MNKEYIKPQAEVKVFESEDIITASGVTTQATLDVKGYSIGKINSLFKQE